MSETSKVEEITFDLVLNTVNSVSLVGAIFVMSVVTLSSYYNCNAAKRLSFRLSMWIAFADAIFCCMSYLSVDPVKRILECNIINAVGYISNLTLIFLTVCMAFNLQMVFVKQQHNPRLTEKFYVTTSFLAAFIIIVPFTVIAIAMDSCTIFPLVQLPYNLIFFWIMIGIWEVVGVLYCSITIIKVVLKLTRFHDDIATLQQGGASPTVDRISDSIQSRVEQVVRRLIFYPLIPVLTQSPYVIAANLSLINGKKTLLERYIYYVPSYSAGILNAVVFLFDPALPEIWKDFKTFMIRKYYLKPLTKGELGESTRFSKFMSKIVYKFLIKNQQNNENEGFRLSKTSHSFLHNGLVLVPPELAMSHHHQPSNGSISITDQLPFSEFQLKSNSIISDKYLNNEINVPPINLPDYKTSQLDYSCDHSRSNSNLSSLHQLSRDNSLRSINSVNNQQQQYSSSGLTTQINSNSTFHEQLIDRQSLRSYDHISVTNRNNNRTMDQTSLRSRSSFYSTTSTHDLDQNQVTLLL